MNREKHNKSTYYQSLTRNMILTVIVVSFTPMLLVIFILFQQFERSYREKTFAHLSELVQKHKQNIDTFLDEKLANIQFIGNNHSFDELNSDEALKELLIGLRKQYGNVFVDLGLINENGHQVAYAGPYELGDAEYSSAQWFRKAVGQSYYISDVFLGLRGFPHFIVAVRQENREHKYLLRSTIDFMAFNSLVQNLRVGETGFAFILNREGEFQTNPVMEYTPCRDCNLFFWEEVEKTKDKILTQKIKDQNGKSQLYGVGSLKGGDWLLILKQQASDAFSDLTRMYYMAVIIFLIGGAGIIAMAFLTSKRMVRRIRRADNEKEQMNEQIIEAGKMASLGELAAGIAHEINNPVAIMVEEAGWIGDLLEEEEFQQSRNLEELGRALAQINTQGKRCKEITHKLLSFARKTDTTLKDVQINELIQEIVALSAQMAKYSKVSLVTELGENLPYITISPSEMQQVLLNLIKNAVDAMEKTGGTINISSKISKLEKDHIVIVVEDNGPGIPESNLPRIFDPFFTTKPVGKGTGLGLSICYGIINKMGGKIDVHSRVGEGTRFRIWIPVQK